MIITCGIQFIYLLIVLIISSTVSTDIFVSNNFTESTCNNVTRECLTIIGAISIASGDDKIFILPGIYSGMGNQAICEADESCLGLSGATLTGLTPDPSLVRLSYGMNSSRLALHIRFGSFGIVSNLTVDNFPATPYLSDEEIDFQSAVVSAGAVYVDFSSSVNFTNVVFRNNSATYGGGINVLESNIRFENCQFYDNLAVARGGGIYAIRSNVIVDNCLFTNNNVPLPATSGLSGLGGGIYFVGINFLEIYNSEFRNNLVERAGGAVYIDSLVDQNQNDFITGSLIVVDSLFVGNKASGSGNCLSSATCNSRGGAIYSGMPGVTVERCIFIGNVVDTDSTIQPAQGGALFLTSDSYTLQPGARFVNITNSNFTLNKATGLGGAVYCSGQLLSIRGSSFIQNSVATVSLLFTDSPSQGGAVWFSSGGLVVQQSIVENTFFADNIAYSGWAGAVFGTDSSAGSMKVNNCTFHRNNAYSSYTNFAQGGAIMVASTFAIIIQETEFTNNTVLPHLDLEPLTYSGSGGAIFAQSASMLVSRCTFDNNNAITGQFDAGATGGAVVLENCNPAQIEDSHFKTNGASGYYGFSSFASPGNGGAIFVKFSAADIHNCDFTSNWVSAGSSEKSGGGAIAVYFSYSSVSVAPNDGVRIENSSFHANAAFSQLCSVSDQSGQGGAIAILGEAYPAVLLRGCNFTSNVATTVLQTGLNSVGGAISVTLSSNVSISNCSFARNAAINGAGDDLASIAGQYEYENYIRGDNITFVSTTNTMKVNLLITQLQFEQRICSYLATLHDLTENSAIRRRLTGGVKEVPSGLNETSATRNTLNLAIQLSPWKFLLTDESFSNTKEIASFANKMVNMKSSNICKEFLNSSAVINILESFHDSNATVSEMVRVKPNPDVCRRFAQLAYQLEVSSHTRFDSNEFKNQSNNNYYYQLTSLHQSQLQSEISNILFNLLTHKLDDDLRGRVFSYDTFNLQETFSSGATNPGKGNTGKSRRMSVDGVGGLRKRDKIPFFLNSSTLDFFVNFHPGIVITNGLAAIKNPTFLGAYHVFFGDLTEVTTYTSRSVTLYGVDGQASNYESSSILYGDIKHEQLVITGVSATVAVFQDPTVAASSNLEIDVVNLFNSTLLIGNNVSITSDSFITESTIAGLSGNERGGRELDYPFLIDIAKNAVVDPHITFHAVAFTGIDLVAVASASVEISNIVSSSFNVTEQTLLTFDACTVVIGNNGELVLDSSVVNAASYHSIAQNDRDETNIRLVLHNNALLNISYGGSLRIVADTIIEASSRNTRAVSNSGSIQLLGQTQSYIYQAEQYFDFAKVDEVGSMGSLTSQFSIFGEFVQNNDGLVYIFLNRTSQSIPVFTISNNDNFGGSVALDFYINNNVYPDLYSKEYGDDPSTWITIDYESTSTTADSFQISPPPGLSFVPTIIQNSLASSSLSKSSFTQFTVSEIGCSQLNTYYDGIPEVASEKDNKYPCHICLKNSSCSICHGGDNPCGDTGTCSRGTKYKTDCCDGGCNGIYGKCVSTNKGHTKYECSCTTIFYTGTNCDQLSTDSYLMIASGAFLVLTILVVMFFFYRARQQRKVVLEELADGLLNHQTSGTENSAYIQYMQQALILNDVFVKYEEITLEKKIGEGSFGVVWKGSFRGAQVAVKQMRSMFAELTESEIDEFRKEAYVMSRLRHPNIVLVMGISLVEQEPPTLPKTRSANISIDPDDSMYPGAQAGSASSNKKSKPPKTVCIITEYLEQGSLADILYGPTKLPGEVWTYELILTCAIQAARGMLYLHSHQPPICHRDLKSSNLVVDDHWVVKVTDFGMSRIVPEKVQDREKGVSTSTDNGFNSRTVSKVRNSSVDDVQSTIVSGKVIKRRNTGKNNIRSLPSIMSEPEIDLDAPFSPPGSRSTSQGDPSSINATSIKEEEKSEDNETENVIQNNDRLPGGQSATDGSQTEDGVQPIDDEDETYQFKRSSVGLNNAVRLSSFNPEMTSNLGTTAWCAPELLTSSTRSRYTVKVDVYSYGMVLWELWEKKRPFDELTSRFDIVDAIREGRRPTISDNCPPSYRSLIQRCWHNDPSRRPMFKYITRYLKDELARVKRQKAQALGRQQRRSHSGNAIGAPLLNPLLFSGTVDSTEDYRSNGEQERDSMDFARTNQDEGITGFLRRSFQTAANRISFSATSGSGQSRPSVSSGSFAAGDSSSPSEVSLTKIGSSAISTAPKKEHEIEKPTDDDEDSTSVKEARTKPDFRSPLIAAAAFDRSLSYLTESPANQPGMHTKSTSNQNRRNSGGASRSMYNNNRWRDSYVLKASGWKSSNPDVGLPPSLTTSSSVPPDAAAHFIDSTSVATCEPLQEQVSRLSNDEDPDKANEPSYGSHGNSEV